MLNINWKIVEEDLQKYFRIWANYKFFTLNSDKVYGEDLEFSFENFPN